jgi:hypothetical protein
MSKNVDLTKNWIPEIVYEDDDNGMSSKIPFIMVPQNEEMPKLIFMFESRETGEFEPDAEGEPLPIVEMDLHQYADMSFLKQGLTPTEYDNVRKCLGLEPLISAVKKGQKITNNIRENVNR